MTKQFYNFIKKFSLLILVFALGLTACENDEIFDLNQQLEAEILERQRADAELSEGINGVSTRLEDFKKLSGEINEAQDAITEANLALSNAQDNALSNDIDILDEELTDAIQDLATDLNNQVSRIDSTLVNNLTALTEAIVAVDAARTAGDDALAAALTIEVETREDETAELIGFISDNASAIAKVASDLQAEVAARSAAISSIQEEIDALIADNADAEAIAVLQGQIADHNTAIATAQSNIVTLNDTVSDINSSIETLQNADTDLGSDIEDAINMAQTDLQDTELILNGLIQTNLEAIALNAENISINATTISENFKSLETSISDLDYVTPETLDGVVEGIGLLTNHLIAEGDAAVVAQINTAVVSLTAVIESGDDAAIAEAATKLKSAIDTLNVESIGGLEEALLILSNRIDINDLAIQSLTTSLTMLAEDISEIDFIDTDELTEAIADFATDADLLTLATSLDDKITTETINLYEAISEGDQAAIKEAADALALTYSAIQSDSAIQLNLITALQNTAGIQQTSINSIIASIDDLETEVEDIDFISVTELTTELAKYTTSENVTAAIAAANLETVSKLNSAVASLTTAIAEGDTNAISVAATALTNAVSELEGADSDNKNLIDALQILVDANADAIVDLGADISSGLASLTLEIEAVQTDVDSIEDFDPSDLEVAIDALVGDVEDLQAQIDALPAGFNDTELQNQIDDAIALIDALNAAVAKNAADIAALIISVSANLDIVHEAIAGLTTDTLDLQAAITDFATDSEVEAAIAAANSEVVAQLNSAVASLTLAINDADNAAIDAAVAELQVAIGDLNTDADAAAALITELQSLVAANTDAIDNDIADLEEANAILEAQVASLQSSLTLSDKALVEAKEALDAMDINNADLQADYDALVITSEALSAKLSELLDEAVIDEAKIAELEADIEALDVEIADLNAEIVEANKPKSIQIIDGVEYTYNQGSQPNPRPEFNIGDVESGGTWDIVHEGGTLTLSADTDNTDTAVYYNGDWAYHWNVVDGQLIAILAIVGADDFTLVAPEFIPTPEIIAPADFINDGDANVIYNGPANHDFVDGDFVFTLSAAENFAFIDPIDPDNIVITDKYGASDVFDVTRVLNDDGTITVTVGQNGYVFDNGDDKVRIVIANAITVSTLVMVNVTPMFSPANDFAEGLSFVSNPIVFTEGGLLTVSMIKDNDDDNWTGFINPITVQGSIDGVSIGAATNASSFVDNVLTYVWSDVVLADDANFTITFPQDVISKPIVALNIPENDAYTYTPPVIEGNNQRVTFAALAGYGFNKGGEGGAVVDARIGGVSYGFQYLVADNGLSAEIVVHNINDAEGEVEITFDNPVFNWQDELNQAAADVELRKKYLSNNGDDKNWLIGMYTNDDWEYDISQTITVNGTQITAAQQGGSTDDGVQWDGFRVRTGVGSLPQTITVGSETDNVTLVATISYYTSHNQTWSATIERTFTVSELGTVVPADAPQNVVWDDLSILD